MEIFSEQTGGETHKTEFAYDRDNRVAGITYDGSSHKVNYTYDELGRVPYCTVYDMGYARTGCIFCRDQRPVQGHSQRRA